MIDKDFLDDFEKILVDTAYTSLEEVPKDDKNYQRLITKLDNSSEKYQKIFNNLNKSQQNILDKYLQVIEEFNSYDIGFIYIKGYRDCVKLLSGMGFFKG